MAGTSGYGRGHCGVSWRQAPDRRPAAGFPRSLAPFLSIPVSLPAVVGAGKVPQGIEGAVGKKGLQLQSQLRLASRGSRRTQLVSKTQDPSHHTRKTVVPSPIVCLLQVPFPLMPTQCSSSPLQASPLRPGYSCPYPAPAPPGLGPSQSCTVLPALGFFLADLSTPASCRDIRDCMFCSWCPCTWHKACPHSFRTIC